MSLLFIVLIFFTFQNFDNTDSTILERKSRAQASNSKKWYHTKKGVALSLWNEKNRNTGNFDDHYAQSAVKDLLKLNPSWYYTWGTSPLKKDNTDIPFFPMIKTHSPNRKDFIFGGNLDIREQLNRLEQTKPSRGFQKILYFNEPDNKHDPRENPLSPKAAAEVTDRSYWRLKKLTNSMVSPALIGVRSDGVLPWTESMYSQLNSNTQKFFTNDGQPSIALHFYPDPFSLHFINTKADLLNPYKSNLALNVLVNRFIKKIHAVKRRHNASIMITEFGVADWAAKEGSGIKNRVTEKFVLEFLKRIVPEFSQRSYISHFAIFNNYRDYGEVLKTNASFTERYSYNSSTKKHTLLNSSLTSVGKYYANYNENHSCRKGEYNSGSDKLVEFFSKECGAPVKFGYNISGRNGWVWNESSQQWRRTLTKEQAGLNLKSSTRGCVKGRFYNNSKKRIMEYKTLACKGSISGWIPFYKNGKLIQYRKSYDPQSDRVGIMEFYIN